VTALEIKDNQLLVFFNHEMAITCSILLSKTCLWTSILRLFYHFMG